MNKPTPCPNCGHIPRVIETYADGQEVMPGDTCGDDTRWNRGEPDVHVHSIDDAGVRCVMVCPSGGGITFGRGAIKRLRLIARGEVGLPHVRSRDTGPWVKLYRGNDWGSDYLSRKPLSDGGTCSTSRAIKVKAGDRVLVRWPDGKESEETIVIGGKTRGTVSDMGHEYAVTSEFPGIDATVGGVVTWLPLDAFEVRAERFPMPEG